MGRSEQLAKQRQQRQAPPPPPRRRHRTHRRLSLPPSSEYSEQSSSTLLSTPASTEAATRSRLTLPSDSFSHYSQEAAGGLWKDSARSKQRDRTQSSSTSLHSKPNHASSCRLLVGAGGHDRRPGQCAGGLVPVRGGRAAFSRHCEWYVKKVQGVKEKKKECDEEGGGGSVLE